MTGDAPPGRVHAARVAAPPTVVTVGDEPASLAAPLAPTLAAFRRAEYSVLQRLDVQRLPDSGLPLAPRQITHSTIRWRGHHQATAPRKL
jgi:hypothetical protein